MHQYFCIIHENAVFMVVQFDNTEGTNDKILWRYYEESHGKVKIRGQCHSLPK